MGFAIKNAANGDVTLKSTTTGGGEVVHHNIDGIAAGSNLIGSVKVRNSGDTAYIDPLAETTYTGRMGEVQASPTANTVLGRLKDLLTGIVLAASSAIIGSVKLAGPHHTPVQTYTTSADMSGADADITPAPTSGLKVVADDITISVGTTMEFSIKEETTATVLWSGFLLANTTIVLSFRNKLRANTVDKKLKGRASVSGQVRIFTSIHSE